MKNDRKMKKVCIKFVGNGKKQYLCTRKSANSLI